MDDENEPKVSSDDPVERKNARRIRIERRKDAAEKAEAEDDLVETEAEESTNPVERTAAECAALIEHLLADAEEKVTNVRIANDAREVARRFAASKKKRELLGKLEEEANSAHDKFQTISAQWSRILELNAPLDIENEMNQQRDRCNDLIQQKDDLIRQLKEELAAADEMFFQDLDKQLNDIKQLGERIDAQVNLMKAAYRSQLKLIESAIEMERTSVLGKNQKQWETLYKRRHEHEVDNTEEKIRQVTEYKEKTDAMMLEHREKYRTTKIQLESEIQELQRELQELKATCFINSEKIDYTYHILKRREEENVLVKTQQKRRLNKMQDVIGELKRKIKNVEKINAIEKGKSEKETEKLQVSMSELQNKADHFASANESKYQRVWKMNKAKSMSLIKKINKMDRIIHEQILGVNWAPSDLLFSEPLELPGPDRSKNQSRSTVSESADSISSCESNDSIDSLVTRILNLLADASGFLIDDKLSEILADYETTSANICKIDSIFKVLDINSEEEITTVFKHLAKYTFCHECEPDKLIGQESLDGSSTDREYEKKDPACDECGISLRINTSDALSALQDFIIKYKKQDDPDADKASASKSAAVSRYLSNKDVSLYWDQYKNVFAQKQKLWDNLIIGFGQYLPVLQDRFKLNEEVVHLRKQNSELKNLLRGHTPSKEVRKQKYLLTPLNKKINLDK